MLDILPTVQAKDVTALLQAILLSAMVQARLLLKSNWKLFAFMVGQICF